MLTRLGFDSLLLTETRTRLFHGVKREQLVSLFGNYFFVQFDIDQDYWRPITGAYGVRRLFGTTPETPTPLPYTTVDSLMQCLNAPHEPHQTDTIRAGCKVKVIRGPLARYDDAHICSWTRGNRVALLMDIMQGTVEVTFDLDSVELVPA